MYYRIRDKIKFYLINLQLINFCYLISKYTSFSLAIRRILRSA